MIIAGGPTASLKVKVSGVQIKTRDWVISGHFFSCLLYSGPHSSLYHRFKPKGNSISKIPVPEDVGLNPGDRTNLCDHGQAVYFLRLSFPIVKLEMPLAFMSIIQAFTGAK